MAEPAKSRVLKSKTAVIFIVAIAAILAWPTARFLFRRTPQNTVEFSRDIQPILNQNCVACHGGVRQKNGVSFIFREEALGTGKSGRRTIVPGDPDASELMARVTSKDPETRMPYHGPPLQPQQIALLREWIKQGAKWQDYWAFIPPKPQPLPQVKHAELGAPTPGSIYSGAAREGRAATGSRGNQVRVVAPSITRPDRIAAHPPGRSDVSG